MNLTFVSEDLTVDYSLVHFWTLLLWWTDMLKYLYGLFNIILRCHDRNIYQGNDYACREGWSGSGVWHSSRGEVRERRPASLPPDLMCHFHSPAEGSLGSIGHAPARGLSPINTENGGIRDVMRTRETDVKRLPRNRKIDRLSCTSPSPPGGCGRLPHNIDHMSFLEPRAQHYFPSILWPYHF